jgi:hypothetical protein
MAETLRWAGERDGMLARIVRIDENDNDYGIEKMLFWREVELWKKMSAARATIAVQGLLWF